MALVLTAGITGVSTYALLLVVARVLGPEGYVDFSAFWAYVLIVSFGGFLPLEQDLARRCAAAGGHVTAQVRRAALTVAAVLAGVAAPAGVLAWSTGLLGSRDPATLAAVLLTCAAGGAQYVGRGLLAGMGRLHGYAAVLLVDALSRVLVVAVLASSTDLAPGHAALVVAGSSLAAALVGLAAAGRPGQARRQGPLASPSTPLRTADLLTSVVALVVAAGALQVLLNSGPLLAKGAAGTADAALAGSLVAAMTLARIPLFVVQSMQPLYLTHVARRSAHGPSRRLRSDVTALVVAAGGLGVVIVVAAAVAGPALLAVLFGGGFVLERWETVLVAATFAAFVVAMVCSDVTIAVGRPGSVTRAWLVALPAGGSVALAFQDLVLRSTLPLGIGACVAAAMLGLEWRRSTA